MSELGNGIINDNGPAPTDAELQAARAAARLHPEVDDLYSPPTPGTTVFIVADFGTIKILQDTLDQLPGVDATVEPMITFPPNTEARVVVRSDPGFVKFALDRQGYARIIRIAESHGPNTTEIPVTPKEP